MPEQTKTVVPYRQSRDLYENFLKANPQYKGMATPEMFAQVGKEVRPDLDFTPLEQNDLVNRFSYAHSNFWNETPVLKQIGQGLEYIGGKAGALGDLGVNAVTGGDSDMLEQGGKYMGKNAGRITAQTLLTYGGAATAGLGAAPSAGTSIPLGATMMALGAGDAAAMAREETANDAFGLGVGAMTALMPGVSSVTRNATAKVLAPVAFKVPDKILKTAELMTEGVANAGAMEVVQRGTMEDNAPIDLNYALKALVMNTAAGVPGLIGNSKSATHYAGLRHFDQLAAQHGYSGTLVGDAYGDPQKPFNRPEKTYPLVNVEQPSMFPEVVGTTGRPIGDPYFTDNYPLVNVDQPTMLPATVGTTGKPVGKPYGEPITPITIRGLLEADTTKTTSSNIIDVEFTKLDGEEFSMVHQMNPTKRMKKLREVKKISSEGVIRMGMYGEEGGPSVPLTLKMYGDSAGEVVNHANEVSKDLKSLEMVSGLGEEQGMLPGSELVEVSVQEPVTPKVPVNKPVTMKVANKEYKKVGEDWVTVEGNRKPSKQVLARLRSMERQEGQLSDSKPPLSASENESNMNRADKGVEAAKPAEPIRAATISEPAKATDTNVIDAMEKNRYSVNEAKATLEQVKSDPWVQPHEVVQTSAEMVNAKAIERTRQQTREAERKLAEKAQEKAAKKLIAIEEGKRVRGKKVKVPLTASERKLIQDVQDAPELLARRMQRSSTRDFFSDPDSDYRTVVLRAINSVDKAEVATWRKTTVDKLIWDDILDFAAMKVDGALKQEGAHYKARAAKEGTSLDQTFEGEESSFGSNLADRHAYDQYQSSRRNAPEPSTDTLGPLRQRFFTAIDNMISKVVKGSQKERFQAYRDYFEANGLPVAKLGDLVKKGVISFDTPELDLMKAFLNERGIEADSKTVNYDFNGKKGTRSFFERVMEEVKGKKGDAAESNTYMKQIEKLDNYYAQKTAAADKFLMELLQEADEVSSLKGGDAPSARDDFSIETAVNNIKHHLALTKTPPDAGHIDMNAKFGGTDSYSAGGHEVKHLYDSLPGKQAQIDSVLNFLSEHNVYADPLREELFAKMYAAVGIDKHGREVKGDLKDGGKVGTIERKIDGQYRGADRANVELGRTLTNIFSEMYPPQEASVYARLGVMLANVFRHNDLTDLSVGKVLDDRMVGVFSELPEGGKAIGFNPALMGERSLYKNLNTIIHEFHHNLENTILSSDGDFPAKRAYVKAMRVLSDMTTEQRKDLLRQTLVRGDVYDRIGARTNLDYYASNASETLTHFVASSITQGFEKSNRGVVKSNLTWMPVELRKYVAGFANKIKQVWNAVYNGFIGDRTKPAKGAEDLHNILFDYMDTIVKNDKELTELEGYFDKLLWKTDDKSVQAFLNHGDVSVYEDAPNGLFKRETAKFDMLEPELMKQVDDKIRMLDQGNINAYYKYLVPFNYIAERFPVLAPVRETLVTHRANINAMVHKLRSILSFDGEKVDNTLKFIHRNLDNEKVKEAMFKQQEEEVVYTPEQLREKFKFNDEEVQLMSNVTQMMAKGRELITEQLHGSNRVAVAQMFRSKGLDLASAKQTGADYYNAVMSGDKNAIAQLGSEFEPVVTKMVGKVQELQTELDARPWYVPLNRSGRYQITYRDANGRPYRTQGYENLKDVKARLVELKQKGIDANVDDTHSMDKNYAAFAPQFLAQLQQLERTRLEALKNVMDPDQYRQEMHELTSMQKTIGRLTSESGNQFKNFEDRHMVGGYREVNPIANTVDYIGALASHLGKQLTKGEMALNLTDDGLMANRALWEKARDHGKYVLNHTTKEFHDLKSGLAFWALGYNMSSLMLNATQPMLTAVPELVRISGSVREAYSSLSSAYMEMARGITDPELAQILTRARAEERIATGQGYEYIDLADDGRMLNLSRDLRASKMREHNILKSGWYNLQHFSRILNNTVEGWNQESVVRAAYKIGKKKGLTGEELYQHVTKTNDLANFTASKANRIGLYDHAGSGGMHASLGVLMSMRSFTANAVAQTAVLFRDALVKKGQSRQVAIKAAAVLAGNALFAGGVLGGIPFASDVSDILQQTLGVDVKKEVREAALNFAGGDDEYGNLLGDLILRGAVSNKFTGVDVSNRIGTGRVIGLDQRSGTLDVFTAAGVSGSIVKNIYNSLGLLGEGRPLDAAQKIAPVAMQNIVRQWRGGEYRDGNNELLVKETQGERMLHTFGLMPKRVSDTFEARNSVKNTLQKVREERNDQINALADMATEKDITGLRETIKNMLLLDPTLDVKTLLKQVADRNANRTIQMNPIKVPTSNADVGTLYRDLYPGIQGADPVGELKAQMLAGQPLGVQPSNSRAKTAAMVAELVRRGMTPEQAIEAVSRVSARR